MLVVLGSLACSCSFCAKFEPAEGCYSEEGDAAVVKVVESQMELYELEHDKEATADLQAAGYITENKQNSMLRRKIRPSPCLKVC